MTLKTRFIFVVTGILILFIVINLWEKYAKVNYPLAKISNLQIGYYDKNQVVVYSDNIPGAASSLIVCGNLDSPNPTEITLEILKTMDEVYSGYNDSTKAIRPGNFVLI